MITAASFSRSHGIPVVTIAGVTYEPMDYLDLLDSPARVIVLRYGREPERTDEERSCAKGFLRFAWFSAIEAAKAVGYASPQSIYSAIREDRLPRVKTGNTTLVNGADLLAL